MHSADSDLTCPAQHLLSVYIREVRNGSLISRHTFIQTLQWFLYGICTATDFHDSFDMINRKNIDSIHNRSLAVILLWNHTAVDTLCFCHEQNRQHAIHCEDCPIEPDLTDHKCLLHRLLRNHTECCQNRYRNRQIETISTFSDICRRQVDRDTLRRKLMTAVAQCSPYPLLRLTYFGCQKTDHLKDRQSVTDICLYRNRQTVDSLQDRSCYDTIHIDSSLRATWEIMILRKKDESIVTRISSFLKKKFYTIPFEPLFMHG